MSVRCIGYDKSWCPRPLCPHKVWHEKGGYLFRCTTWTLCNGHSVRCTFKKKTLSQSEGVPNET